MNTAFAFSFFACQVCSLRVNMPLEAHFAVLRLLVIVWLTRRYLDWVRLLLVFGIIELGVYGLTGYLIWNFSPIEEGHQAAKVCLNLAWLVYHTGLPAVLMLKCFSCRAYFRPRGKRLTWRWCFILVSAWTLLFLIQDVWRSYR
jgi:hypothetical protein